MNHDALMMEFRDKATAKLAADTFEELGYEPRVHEGGRLHIHVRNEDLTSALEIMQCHGGNLVERAPAEALSLAEDAYRLDAIPIPAHTVNEDWPEAYGSVEPEAWARDEGFRTDDGSYDHFEAT
ncbi:hypothetical protein GE107_05960 [Cohnella sp. CFH 77786]|uniref:hypothetical protein n=1 Tax=Cohnella sp. CFH 77786 TaxID=2662265 RepID=UPI001C60FB1E|nr:hypothetical protein [Cohnella sp. CFH 77786]MBW5445607.1 hypothetical protein [Cohnella sp. CFH 77786]